jgi:hypothetical protein
MKCWEERYEELEHYKEKHKDCNVPQKFTETPGLGHWVMRQRDQYLTGNLNSERKSKLDQLGFAWNLIYMRRTPKISQGRAEFSRMEGKTGPATCWVGRWAELERYKQKHKDCNVPRGYAETPGLGSWVNRQRKEYRSGNLNLERKEKLDQLGFVWNTYASSWEESYAELEHYKQVHGHCNVPQKCPEAPGAAHFVKQQRDDYRNGNLNLERKSKLDQLGFVWNTSISCWEKRYTELESYQQVHGHCNVPNVYNAVPGLGRWVAGRRTEHRLGQMPPEREALLNKIGFQWRIYKKRGLEGKSKLDQLGFVCNVISKRTCWEKRHVQLESYQQVHGHCNVPQKYTETPGLGRWVARQRTEHRKDQIPPEREALLNKIGFQWRINKKPELEQK